jgi:hypothetical protein
MRLHVLGGAAVLALAAVTPALADSQNPASTTGTGSVTIYTPLAVSQTQGLDFGVITSGASAGTVAIAQSNGARSVGGGVGSVAANVGKVGQFSITGQASASINVVVASAITGFSGGITGTTDTTGGVPTALGSGGSVAFNVGGALNIPASTPAGSYSGTYAVTVNYP